MQSPRQLLRHAGGHEAFQFLFLGCLGIILSITAYGIIATIMGHVDVVGAALVDVNFPPPNLFPLYAKPVSYLMAALLGLTYSGLELAKPRMLRSSNSFHSFLKLIAFVGGALAAYEVMYNFAIWTAEISTNSLLGVLNPDVIVNQFPNPKEPWNLVFATKLSTTLLAIGLYVFYYIRQVEREKLRLFQ